MNSKKTSHSNILCSTRNADLIHKAIELYAAESLDVSAGGLLRVILTNEALSADEIIYFLAPRDYDVAVRIDQLNRIQKSLAEVANGP